MAARRKRPISNEGPFAVAVEQLGSQFRVFGEALTVVNEGLALVQEDVSIMKEDLSRVKAAVLENTRDIKVLKSDMIEVRRTVGRIEGRLDLKVDRDEVLAIVEGAGPRT